ncbi:MAG: ABC transporter permease [Opitutae bacterium]|nr:ABC transporter permease [Opitutae bacterium]
MLLRCNIAHFWRRNLGVILGSALCTMVLAGALLVGDSVRESLHRIAEQRIGQVDSLLFTEDRFFREALATQLEEKLDATAAPIFILRGSVSNPDADEETGQIARVPNIQVLGIDERFFQLAPRDSAASLPLEDGRVYVNQRLAKRLAIDNGATLNIRLEEPALFSRDAPLSGTSDKVARISRQKVSKILGPEEFGNFALHGSQIPPYTIYIPIQSLRDGIETEGQKANLLLIGKSAQTEFSTNMANDVLEEVWALEDGGIEYLKVNDGRDWSLRSGSIFINHVLEKGFRKVAPATNAGVMTYLVNAFEANGRTAPYSFATAFQPGAAPELPNNLADDEILVNQWLAEDLGLKPGSELSLKYFITQGRRELKESTATFKVRAILPMPKKFSKGQESDWTPAFPGLSDEENCRDWEPGFAIDENKIREKDEDYWDDYRGTPKAYINLSAGQKMWSNRWGQTTGIRIPVHKIAKDDLDNTIKEYVTASDAGLHFKDLRGKALESAKGSIDLGEYISYFSFFIILASLALTGMLFVFSIEQRNQQAGVLLAIGYTEGKVRRLFLIEGIVLAIAGGIVGCILSLVYAKGILWGLTNVWKDATGAMQFDFTTNFVAISMGFAIGIFMAAIALWLASHKQLRKEPRELLNAGDQLEIRTKGRPTGKLSHFLSIALFVGGLLYITFTGGSGSGAASANFFLSGFLFLLAALFFFNGRLARIAYHQGDTPDLNVLGFRNTARRRGRSLVTIGVLASGVFMVVAVSSFHVTGERDWEKKTSGTGGFAIVAKSAIPIYNDLNTKQGREEFGLDEKILAKTNIVPFRVREGDDASCLNLNKATEPTILGINPSELAGRFKFAGTKHDWSLLDADKNVPDILPGIADQNTVTYALQQKLGGLIDYKDENGRPFQIRIAGVIQGSLLQGRVLIAEKYFIEKFPSQAGYRYFLADTKSEEIETVAAHLSNILHDQGMEAHPAWKRLGEFLAVQNSYLSIFQALGGLGLLLGTAGLGIVVARNLMERRHELGLLEAIGYSLQSIRKMAIVEHRWLMLWGLAAGTGTALIAVWPAILSRQGGFPASELGVLLLGLASSSLFWIWLATILSLKNSAIPDLRKE